MKSSNQESYLKIWIDRVLIIDLFFVLLGSLMFIVSIILSYFGNNLLINFIQLLWKPLFIPAITILITASLFNGLLDWLKRQGLWSGKDT